MTGEAPDVASVVRALSDADVQFVLVGEVRAGLPLRLVVSRHPTNLDALGRALDRLGSTVRGPGDRAGGGAGAVPDPRRVGDPLGTIAVTTSAGDVDLLFGGARHSLYTEVVARAQERDFAGVRVQWTDELADPVRAPRTTGRMLGRRLLTLAEGLAHLIERTEGGDGKPDAEAGRGTPPG